MSWYEEQAKEEIKRIKKDFEWFIEYLYSLPLDEPRKMLKSLCMHGAIKPNKGTDKIV